MLSFCVVIAVVKEGMCPAVEPGTVGICIIACENDAHCEGSSKCCSNGCGTVCATPEPGVLFMLYRKSDCRIFRVDNFTLDLGICGRTLNEHNHKYLTCYVVNNNETSMHTEESI